MLQKQILDVGWVTDKEDDKMHLTTLHLYSLSLTLFLVALIGVAAARKVKTSTDFVVGGRTAGVSIVVGTIIGTIIGGASTIGTAQLAFSTGIAALWFTLGTGLALLLMAFFYAKPLRNSGLQTIPEYLVASYGGKVGPLSSISASIGIFFSIVANILSATPLVGAVFGLNALQAAGLVFVLVTAYVFFGGVWGTGIAGIVKSLLIYITLFAVGYTAYVGMSGFHGFVTVFPQEPWFNIFGRGFWVDFGGALSLMVGTLSTQTYIQALYSARDAKAARRGAMIAALITIPTGIPAVMAGLYMRANHPDIAPINALPDFIILYLPPWLGGVAIGALLLAAVGSAAGLALGVGTMVSRDLIAGFLKHGNERLMLQVTRLTVFLITLAAALFTFGNLRSLVLEWNYLSMGLRGAGTFLPFTAAVFCPRNISQKWAVWSMVAGTVTAVGWKILFPQGADPLYAGLGASAALLLAGYFAVDNSLTNNK